MEHEEPEVELGETLVGLKFARWTKKTPRRATPNTSLISKAYSLDRAWIYFVGIVIYAIFGSANHPTVLVCLIGAIVKLRSLISCRFAVAPSFLKEIIDRPETDRQFPVRISVSSRGVELGRDIGLISFTGDFIHFEGSMTSFGFSNAHSVFHPNFISSPDRPQKSSLRRLKMGWKAGDQSGVVTIRPYDRIPGESGYYENDFVASLRSWYWKPSESHQNFILPPLYPEPTFVDRISKEYAFLPIVSFFPFPCSSFVLRIFFPEPYSYNAFLAS